MSARSVSVDLTVDVSAFHASLRRISQALDLLVLGAGCRRAGAAFADLAAGLDTPEIRRAADREEIRQLALLHRAELADWLDQRAGEIYRDLGLRRPPSNLIRGEE